MLDIEDHQGIAVPHVEPAVRDGRMGTMLTCTLYNIKGADCLLSGASWPHEGKATVLTVAVQHPIGVNNRTLANKLAFVPYLAAFPVKAHPLLGLRVCAMNVTINEHDPAVMWVQL
ncbi:MAG: hypothetical protein ACYSTZ_06140, partial [Planctomycetota bacterium]